MGKTTKEAVLNFVQTEIVLVVGEYKIGRSKKIYATLFGGFEVYENNNLILEHTSVDHIVNVYNSIQL